MVDFLIARYQNEQWLNQIKESMRRDRKADNFVIHKFNEHVLILYVGYHEKNIVTHEDDGKFMVLYSPIIEKQTSAKLDDSYHQQTDFEYVFMEISENVITVTPDKYGIQLVYYFDDGENIGIASSIKHLLFVKPNYSLTLDYKGLASLLLFHYYMGEHTLYQEIRCLRPFSSIEVTPSSNSFKIIPTQNLPKEYRKKLTSDTFDEIHKLIKHSTDLQTTNDIILYLSGGLDSRLLLDNLKSNQNLLSVTFGQEDNNEVQFAKCIAKYLNVDYEFFEIRPNIVEYALQHLWITEGGSPHTVSYTHSLTQNFIGKLIVDGYLGDAIFGGSYIDKFGLDPNYTSEEILYKLNPYADYIFSALNESIGKTLRENMLELISNELNYYSTNIQSLQYEYFMLFNRGRRHINTGSLAIQEYTPTIKPFFHKEFADYCLNLDVSERYQRKFYSTYILKYREHLLNCNFTSNYYYSRKESSSISRTINKYKLKSLRLLELMLKRSFLKEKSYVPIDTWLRKDSTYKQWVQNVLFDKRTLERGFFSKDGLQAIFSTHDGYRKNFGTIISFLVDFELILRLYQDKDGFNLKFQHA